MWTGLCSAAALLLGAGPPAVEAEDLARASRIVGGGDVVVIADPADGRLKFSGGKALVFVPRGRGSGLDVPIRAPQAGVYRLVVYGVSGPSCGMYDLLHDGRKRGCFNFGASPTRLERPLRSERMRLVEGLNRVTFAQAQPGPRGGCLVLDRLELAPHVPPAPPPPDRFDAEVPATESHGEELIANGGFEDFQPHDRFSASRLAIGAWQFNSAVPQETECIVRDPAQAHSGRQCLYLKPDTLEDYAIVYQPFRAESGKRYRVSLYARGTGLIRVDFYQYGGTIRQEDSARVQNTFAVSQRWQCYSFVMEPSRSGRVVRVAIALHGLEGGAWFDDVSVREVLNPRSGP